MTNMQDRRAALTEQQLFQKAITHHQAGRLRLAERLYRAILRAHPQHPDANHNLGMLAVQMRQTEAGLPHFRTALEANPAHEQYRLSYIAALIETDQIEVARRILAEGRQQGLRGAAADMLAGRLDNPSPDELTRLADMINHGRYAEGELLAKKLVARFPGNGVAWKMLGAMLKLRGRGAEALAPMHKAIELLPGDVEARSNLGATLKDLGRLDEAVVCYRQALEGRHGAEGIHSAMVGVHTGLSAVLGKIVPGWHVPMINHAVRNEAYQNALRSAVTTESLVLEIGTGSGLLAMMAARLGAGQVVTCEVVPLIAATAQEIIADNLLTSSIRVIPKKSTELQVGSELPQRANLLVSEIFSSELLGEGVLPSIEDAKQRLLTPDARIIPASGSIVFALFGGDEIKKNIMADQVCGFDLRKFNAIVARKQLCYRNDLAIDLLTGTAEAFSFNFAQQDHFPNESKTVHLPIEASGRCYGIIQWIRLHMDDRHLFENHPSLRAASSSWQQVIYPFPAPIDVVAGQTAVISVAHNRTSVWFYFEGLEEPPGV